MHTSDVVIIGAGVVGCATALQLSSTCEVTVLEQHGLAGLETSRRNSGVIHSGIHLPTQSLKARLARRGRHLTLRYCQEQDVPLRQVGMRIVVAPEDVFGLWPETANLLRMVQRAASQRIPIRFESGAGLHRREPAIRCLFGLFLPAVHIIDQVSYVQSLRQQAQARSAQFHFNQEVVGLVRDGSAWRVITGSGEYKAKVLINMAGLAAATVANMADHHYHQYFYRGEYYEVDQAASGLHIHSLIYPVHRPGRPGLGVHLTPTVDGRFLLGPNAKRVRRMADYETDPTPADDFCHDVRQFLPGLKPWHLRWAYSGIRPKLTDTPGENDFIVVREQGTPVMINCIGIESPGLTAALALAEHVAQLLP